MTHSLRSSTLTNGITPIFDKQHLLSGLVKPHYDYLINQMSDCDINFTFNSPIYNANRKPIRQEWNDLFGEGSNLMIPISAAYLTKPNINTIFLPNEIDRSLVSYMQNQQLLGKTPDVIYINELHDILTYCTRNNRTVYTFDDLGSQFDEINHIDQKTYEFLNSKDSVAKITKYHPQEIIVDIDNLTNLNIDQVYQPDRALYIKLCNTESGGFGVTKVFENNISSAKTKILEALSAYKSLADKHSLKRHVLIQPEIIGENKSFQVYIDNHNDFIPVVSLSKLLIAEDGRSYAGSIVQEVNAENLQKVGPAIIDIVNNIRQLYPNISGYFMCDYFETATGEIVLYDPGLRPSACTPPSLVHLLLERELKQNCYIQSFVAIDSPSANYSYANVAKSLGQYADLEAILSSGYGVLPWGYNHIQGKGLYLIITPDKDQHDTFYQHIKKLVA